MALSGSCVRHLATAMGHQPSADEIATAIDTIDELGAAEVAFLDGVTAGTAAASKALVLGTSKEIATITTATITTGNITTVNATNIDAGASGTAGTVDIFPTTASKGKFILSCTDQDGATNVTFKPAAMGQATVVSIPDPGAATANVLLTDQANDGSVVTATAAELNQLDATTLTAGSIIANLATTAGTGITGAAASFASSVTKVGSLFKTTIVIDLTGLRSTAANDIIGDDGTANPCHIGQITAARNGTIFAGSITCLEAPAGGDPDIDLYSATESTGVEDGAIGDLTETQLINSGDHAVNAFKSLTAFPAANEYLYLVAGDTTDADYTAGILVIELWGK